MRFWLTEAALLWLLILAVRRGGQPERWVAIAFAVTFFVGLAVDAIRVPAGFKDFDVAYFMIDLALLCAIFHVALKANRLWPICASALQLIVVICHLVKLTPIDAMPGVYWGMTTVPQYAQLLTLLVGIRAHSQRSRRLGAYPDWNRPQVT